MIDSQNCSLSPRRRPGHQRTEQLPTVDRTGAQVNPSLDPVPWVDVRVVLFTVNDGRLLIALQEQRTGPALPRRQSDAGREPRRGRHSHSDGSRWNRGAISRSSSIRFLIVRKAFGP